MTSGDMRRPSPSRNVQEQDERGANALLVAAEAESMFNVRFADWLASSLVSLVPLSGRRGECSACASGTWGAAAELRCSRLLCAARLVDRVFEGMGART